MAWLETLIPNEWQRKRFKMHVYLVCGVLLLLLWLACLPYINARHKVAAARAAVARAAVLTTQYQQKHGRFPAHVPMNTVARMKATMANMGAGEMTTFAPGTVSPRPIDPFSANSGSEPVTYFATQIPPYRWLTASMGPDRMYQLRGSDLAAYAQHGAGVLAHAEYDPTNGTSSVGDIIQAGP